MKNLNLLKWFVLVFVLVGVTAIFWLLTEDYARDAQFYISLACLLFSIIVSTYAINLDMLFKATQLNDFPHRVAFMTLSFIYEGLVIVSIIAFYMIKRLDLNIFASIMIGWLIVFVILTYALIMLNRFVSSNDAATRSFSIQRGQLDSILIDLQQHCQMNPNIGTASPVAKKIYSLTEKIKYSDPTSREEVSAIDAEILQRIQSLQSQLPHVSSEEEQQTVVNNIMQIENLIQRRNQTLLSLK